MSIDAISSLTHPVASPYADQPNGALGRADFLTLLIAQLQQQDPLNPQDSAEFTAQLAQFSSLEQLMSLNGAISDLQMLQLSANNTLAASLIGKDVLFAGDTLTIEAEGPVTLHYYTSVAVEGATITIRDSSGEIVRTIGPRDLAEGTGNLVWDGLDDSGLAVAPGEYTISIEGSDAAGNPLTVTALQLAHATGIVFENGITYLIVGDTRLALGDIFGIYEPSNEPAVA